MNGHGKASSLKRYSYNVLRKNYQYLPTRVRAILVGVIANSFLKNYINLPPHLYASLTVHPKAGGETDNCSLIDITACEANIQSTPKLVAVHCHIYYNDLVREFSRQLSAIPFPFDLFVSVSDEEGANTCRIQFGCLKNVQNLNIKKVINRGRDIAPMFCEFGNELVRYHYLAHIQSKKSCYNNGATRGWREYLLNALLGTSNNVERIFRLFEDHADLGIIYPQTYRSVPYIAHTWLANSTDGIRLCKEMCIAMPEGYFNFPAGSMFWARISALKPLFDLGLQWDDFPLEQGQTDGTLAHAIERLLGVVPKAQGLRTFCIRDLVFESWSTFRFDHQYLNRSKDFYMSRIDLPDIKVVAFDIFDTLLTRPLIEPDNVKRIVAARLQEKERQLYNLHRREAESTLRQRSSHDVGFVEIFDEFKKITNLCDSRISSIMDLEKTVEIESVAARSSVIDLMVDIKMRGYRVILISDMFLPLDVIEEMLYRNRIVDWDRIYLSSEEGVRKSDGKLYNKVLETEGLKGSEMVMIGDDERSDIQIPSDMHNINNIHVLKSVHLGRHSFDFSCLLSSSHINENLNREIGIGLMVQKYLNEIHSNGKESLNLFGNDPYKIGFNLVGPLVSSFCCWLIEQANRDGIRKLYFLSREGEILKEVFDFWASSFEKPPKSHYLVVSRRATTVSCVQTFDDLRKIAAIDFSKNTIELYLLERFGLELEPEIWENIHDRKLWAPGKKWCVKNGDIEEIEPLLYFLFDSIASAASKERVALISYLNSLGVGGKCKAAVVDVGYSGTIQKALCTLLGIQVHGYYFATSDKIRLGLQKDVIARGCFAQLSDPASSESYHEYASFLLEKILSSNTAQLIKYRADCNGNIQGVFKELSQLELDSVKVRDVMRRGMLDYTHRALDVKKSLYPDFTPDCYMADKIYTKFVKEHEQVLNGIYLDDHYCGRGIV